MQRRRFGSAALLAAALLVMTGLAVTQSSVTAQATGTPASGMTELSHPAHIHAGTCATLGDVVYPLSNVDAPGMMASPMAGMEMTTPTAMAGMMASPTTAMGATVVESSTTVQVSLNDLLGTQYAINVHESADNIQNYIACGEITGTPTDHRLQVRLNELNSSGYAGQAWLTDNGDGTTTVLIELTHTMGAMATPAS